MKRRVRKKNIVKEEQSLAQAILLCLTPADLKNGKASDICEKTLSTSLIYLLKEKLALDKPQWPSEERWLDGIDWHELNITNTNQIKGKGTLWWAHRGNYNLEKAASFETELNLLKKGTQYFVSYKMTFESEGHLYHICG